MLILSLATSLGVAVLLLGVLILIVQVDTDDTVTLILQITYIIGALVVITPIVVKIVITAFQ